MIELDCIACGHSLRDATHHTDSVRDEGHSAMPFAWNPDYIKAPAINLPKRRAVLTTPWAERWDEKR